MKDGLWKSLKIDGNICNGKDCGGMAEWFKAAVLKTASLKGDVGSNPTPSAMRFMCKV